MLYFFRCCCAFLVFLVSLHAVNAQIVGGRGNGEPLPTKVEKSKLSGGSFDGEVNLFNGNYSSSYELGTVTNPGSDLNFTLRLNYSSVLTTGNRDQCSGVEKCGVLFAGCFGQ